MLFRGFDTSLRDRLLHKCLFEGMQRILHPVHSVVNSKLRLVTKSEQTMLPTQLNLSANLVHLVPSPGHTFRVCFRRNYETAPSPACFVCPDDNYRQRSIGDRET